MLHAGHWRGHERYSAAVAGKPGVQQKSQPDNPFVTYAAPMAYASLPPERRTTSAA